MSGFLGSWASKVWTVVRVVIPPLAIGWLAVSIGRDSRFAVGDIQWPFAVAACLLSLMAVLAAAWRLILVLRLLPLSLGLRDSWRITLQSMFYLVFVPVAAGADVARYGKLAGSVRGGAKTKIVFALIIDRALGVCTSLAIFIVGWFIPGALPDMTVSFKVWHLAALGAAAIGVAAIVLFLVRRKAAVLQQALRTLSFSVGTLSGAFLASLLSQSLLFSAIWLMSIAMGFTIALSSIFFVGALCVTVQVMPLSLLGVGTGEAAGVVLYQMYGQSLVDATMLAFVPYLFKVLAGGLGGLSEWYEGIRDLGKRNGKSKQIPRTCVDEE